MKDDVQQRCPGFSYTFARSTRHYQTSWWYGRTPSTNDKENAYVRNPASCFLHQSRSDSSKGIQIFLTNVQTQHRPWVCSNVPLSSHFLTRNFFGITRVNKQSNRCLRTIPKPFVLDTKIPVPIKPTHAQNLLQS